MDTTYMFYRDVLVLNDWYNAQFVFLKRETSSEHKNNTLNFAIQQNDTGHIMTY